MNISISVETEGSATPRSYEGSSAASAVALLSDVQDETITGISVSGTTQVNGEERKINRKVSPNDKQPNKDGRIASLMADTIAWLDEVNAVS